MLVEVWSSLHEDDFRLIKVFQVRTEDEHTSRHDVEYDSPLNGSRPNTTTGHTDEAGESDEGAQSDHSRSDDDDEPDGSEYEEDDESEEEDGGDEEPALKYERMGGAAQEFFETGKDSASSLCVGKDSFVSTGDYCGFPAYRPYSGTIGRGMSFGRRLPPSRYCKGSGRIFPEVLSSHNLMRF
jgi:hypothetical protein